MEFGGLKMAEVVNVNLVIPSAFSPWLDASCPVSEYHSTSPDRLLFLHRGLQKIKAWKTMKNQKRPQPYQPHDEPPFDEPNR